MRNRILRKAWPGVALEERANIGEREGEVAGEEVLDLRQVLAQGVQGEDRATLALRRRQVGDRQVVPSEGVLPRALT